MSTAKIGISSTSTSAGQTLLGTGFDDKLRGFSDNTVLSGGGGNDTYYLGSVKNVVVEGDNGGIDTVYSSWSYTLGSNLENLFIGGDRTFGIGNDLSNVIVGNANAQSLYGAGGNDTLTGGGGADVFIVRPGSGNDTITDFQSGIDSVRVGSYGFKSFSEVVANMKEVGSNVVLTMAGETLTFANKKIADFSAQDFKLALDTSKFTATFTDEFDSLSLQSQGGIWRPTFYADGSLRRLPTNGEQQIYMDPAYKGLGINPLSVANGILTIHAEKASDAVKSIIGGDYTSGMISSKSGFAQTYGYFEIKCEIPAGKGAWPAFWLLPQDGTWPPELDVFEVLGDDTSRVYTTAHSSASGKHTAVGSASLVGDLSDGMHTYGLIWTKTDLIWYIDGEEVFRAATPADMHKPMFMIANLAIGGYWPGTPDPNITSLDMKIDYIKAYSINEAATQTNNPNAAAAASVFVVNALSDVVSDTISGDGDLVKSSITYSLPSFIENLTLTGTANINGTGNGENNIIHGNAGNNVLSGLAGNDTFYGHGGTDKLMGGLGNDVYYVTSPSEKIVEYGNEGRDVVHATFDYSLGNNLEDLYLDGSALKGVGNGLDNSIFGNAANNYLAGNAGTDTLYGYGGNDMLVGGAGNDTMIGGKGDDIYNVDATGDVVVENAGEGTDTVNSSVSYTLSANVERLVLLGNGNIGGTGNGLDNIISGNAGHNSFSGMGGSDTLVSNGGNDVMWGGAGADIFIFNKKGTLDIKDFGFNNEADQLNVKQMAGGKSITIKEVGADTFIHFSDGSDIILRGVDADALHYKNGIFYL